MPEFAISTDKVGFLIEKMREFDVKEGATDLDFGVERRRRQHDRRARG